MIFMITLANVMHRFTGFDSYVFFNIDFVDIIGECYARIVYCDKKQVHLNVERESEYLSLILISFLKCNERK